MVNGNEDLAKCIAEAAVSSRDAEMKEENVEWNSGVECPGNISLEPYIGSTMILEDRNFTVESVLVEIASPLFFFKYTK